MGNSTERISFAQSHPNLTHPEPRYLATNGVDLIESGLTLDWIVDAARDRCCLCREDIAIWILSDTSAPWIVAVVRPSLADCVAVQWL